MTDRDWAAQALALAALGEGRTRPNPRVGCLVVKDGIVVGRGLHLEAGAPHAEAIAIEEAGGRARGSTVYVNLEPCAHHGRTPPCADLLVRSGVARVVASIQDPNPLVDGEGFDRLRRAGIAVDAGILAEEARRLNAPFLRWHLDRRPQVTLKAGATLDGRLSAAEGRSRWITGEASRRFAHRLRLRHDAILVGAGTVRADDPRLTVRLPGVSAPRLRVVLDPEASIPPTSRVVLAGPPGTPRTRVYASAAAATRTGGRIVDAEVVATPCAAGRLDLRAVLEDLATQGIQSVLVEGGGRTIGAFLAAGLADEAAIFVAPRLMGEGGTIPLVGAAGAADPSGAPRLVRARRISFGADLLLWGEIERGRG